MKIKISLILSIFICLSVYIFAKRMGAEKFEISGMLMVLSGGYFISALLELFLTLPLFALTYLFVRLFKKDLRFLPFVAILYVLYTLYTIIAQFADAVLIKNLGLLDFFLFELRFQAIGTSMGAGFLAALFSGWAFYQSSRRGEKTWMEWIYAFGITLPIYLAWIIPLSLTLNNIAWSHLPIE